MKAILWDGHKKINGELVLDKNRIQFLLADFGKTDLNLDMPYRDIKEVNYYSLYQVTISGVEIVSIQGKHNVFIVEDPQSVKKDIQLKQFIMK